MLPLTPIYNEERHEIYSNAIESALTGMDRESIKNIALTGSYGVGKSSILKIVAAKRGGSIVQVSLSTLGLPDEENVPDSPIAAKSKTNQIQKEIVKQLLYREDPTKTPGSRFRRIGRFHRWRGLGLAALAAVAFTVLFSLTGWSPKLVELVKPHFDPGLWAHLGLFVVFTGFVFALEAAFHNRLRIQSFTAGYATISLSGDTATYFDQYLDEIVYFFEVTKSDIVIFEDIDRFDDPHIFETLRALNTLLNCAKQLQGRNIRFIYAIKDSIFDELGRRAALEEGEIDASNQVDAADAEVARANRTKFFDLVIPVVPFITHRSARDLMFQVMDGIEHKVTTELFDLAARHLADMRLIKNVRNEFVIFREKILLDKESVPGLTQDQLFAMMLYKSTHLSDFEAIKAGQSKLDQIYANGRRLVTQNLASLNAEERECIRRLSDLDSLADRSEDLGNRLISHIERIALRLGFPAQIQRTVTFENQRLSDDDLRSADFWRRFTDTDAGDNNRVVITFHYNNVQYSIHRSDLSESFGDPLSAASWQEFDRESLRSQLRTVKEKLDFLPHADMSDLMKHAEFGTKSDGGEPKSFAQLADELLDSELARQLVEAGYIN